MIDRYDIYGRRMEDTEPDMAAWFVRFDQHDDRIRALEAALRKYGSHDDDCPGGFKNMACTCGWGQARAALAPKEPT